MESSQETAVSSSLPLPWDGDRWILRRPPPTSFFSVFQPSPTHHGALSQQVRIDSGASLAPSASVGFYPLSGFGGRKKSSRDHGLPPPIGNFNLGLGTFLGSILSRRVDWKLGALLLPPSWEPTEKCHPSLSSPSSDVTSPSMGLQALQYRRLQSALS